MSQFPFAICSSRCRTGNTEIISGHSFSITGATCWNAATIRIIAGIALSPASMSVDDRPSASSARRIPTFISSLLHDRRRLVGGKLVERLVHRRVGCRRHLQRKRLAAIVSAETVRGKLLLARVVVDDRLVERALVGVESLKDWRHVGDRRNSLIGLAAP